MWPAWVEQRIRFWPHDQWPWGLCCELYYWTTLFLKILYMLPWMHAYIQTFSFLSFLQWKEKSKKSKVCKLVWAAVLSLRNARQTTPDAVSSCSHKIVETWESEPLKLMSRAASYFKSPKKTWIKEKEQDLHLSRWQTSKGRLLRFSYLPSRGKAR